MKKRFFLISLMVLFLLTGCEGTANNNLISSIFIGNEWKALLLSVFMIVSSLFAILSEKGLQFFLSLLRGRRHYWQSREITESDLTLARFGAYITIVLGGFGFLMSLYYLIFY